MHYPIHKFATVDSSTALLIQLLFWILTVVLFPKLHMWYILPFKKVKQTGGTAFYVRFKSVKLQAEEVHFMGVYACVRPLTPIEGHE